MVQHRTQNTQACHSLHRVIATALAAHIAVFLSSTLAREYASHRGFHTMPTCFAALAFMASSLFSSLC